MEKVSIVVPVYNAEKYLAECIESLINQTYRNIEIILVNDGSTDRSYEICEQYAKNDLRIQVFTQKNGGISKARNKGIAEAKGSYILFVDSDDYCELKMVENAVKNAKNDTLYIWSYTEVYKNKIIQKKFKQDITIGNIDEIFQATLFGSSCNKIFSLDIIREKKLHFDEEVYNTEDLLFIFTYLQYVKEIKYDEKFLYNHRIGKNIIMFYIKPSLRNMTILYAYEKILLLSNISEKVKNKIKYEYILAYYRMKEYIPSDFRIDYELLREEKNILISKKYSAKEKLRYIAVKYFDKLYKKYCLSRIDKNELFE